MIRSLVCSTVLALAAGAPLAAQTVPAGYSVETLSTVLSSPTSMAVAPDGRIFICYQNGNIRVWKPGSGLLPTPFHTFSVSFFGERGLIGITLAPDFAESGTIYAHVSRSAIPGPDIVRLAASKANPDVSDPNSVTVLASLDAYSSRVVHVGGAIRFGPDGKLYIGLGDNNNPDNAQDLAAIYGKVLRFNPDGSIPEDNPFFNATTGNARAIWSLGLRNPYTMEFRPGTPPGEQELYINDVGESEWEEINRANAPGLNFGWYLTDGDFDPQQFPAYTRPFLAYGHSPSQGPIVGIAITGGEFYYAPNPSFPPSFTGKYLFSDFRGWVKRLDPATREVTPFLDNTLGALDVAVDGEGRLLVLVHDAGSGGRLLRISSNLCRADFNSDGTLNSADFFDFLVAFFASAPSADYNADTFVNSQDFFDFLGAFFTGCV